MNTGGRVPNKFIRPRKVVRRGRNGSDTISSEGFFFSNLWQVDAPKQ